MKTDKSKALYERAVTLMPGGVSSPVRAFRSVGGTPLYFREARGARFVDEDGNEFLDFCLSWGPLILGHAHPAVVEAVRVAAGRGLTYGACCRAEIDLAELILSAFKGRERVRFVSSGTEAVMTAIRLARGVTGRPRILKFEGGYHGHSDSLLVKAGSGLVTFGLSSSAGVTPAVAADTIVCPLDDEGAVAEAFALHGDTIAAVIVEPLPANNGLLEQRVEWLRSLRELTSRHGALLVFDEVISGFRFCFGGYGDAVGVRADIVTLGKIIGGGMPVGAVVGPAAIMDKLAPLGPVYQAGTLSGNPVSLAAGIATLRELSKGLAYDTLEELGAALARGLAAHGSDLPFVGFRRRGSVFWFHLAPGEAPRRADRIDPDAGRRYNRIYHAMLERGIYLAPSAYEVGFFSTAHTVADAERLAAELAQALRAAEHA
ncbi:MAG: glutamate-1-semialdehyde 2,1-aminomutase [Deltaproteobacteria bacterium]|nr:glutamate-1-semialdehyde 2,1-aminomutase [Deltaproteobacteria bacterium]